MSRLWQRFVTSGDPKMYIEYKRVNYKSDVQLLSPETAVLISKHYENN